MTRFACLAVLAASLFGCTPSQEDLTGYLNRNPALKTLQFGFQYNLDRPAGFDSIRDFATAREYAFVGASNRDCQAVAVYALADAEAGLRAPQQVLSSCDGEAYGGDNFALRLDTRGDLLVAGAGTPRSGAGAVALSTARTSACCERRGV